MLADLCQAADLTREQAINALGALTKVELVACNEMGWDKRDFWLTPSDLRPLVVEVCKLLE